MFSSEIFIQFPFLFVIAHAISKIKSSSINKFITNVNFISKTYIYIDIWVQLIFPLLFVYEKQHHLEIMLQMTSTTFSIHGSFFICNQLIIVLLARYNMTIFFEICKKTKGLIRQFSSPGPCKYLMMSCFCGMVDQRKAFSFISSQDHCQWSSPSRIFDMLWAGFEPAHNLS